VMAWCFPQFGHNYNQVSREVMENFFNVHLKLGLPQPVRERSFVPVQPKDLSVYDAAHPRPKDEVGAEGVKKVMTEWATEQMRALAPADETRLDQFQGIVGAALRTMVHDRLPGADEIDVREIGPLQEQDGRKAHQYWIGRKGSGESFSAYGVGGPDFDGSVVVWISPVGKGSLFVNGQPSSALKQALDRRAAVLAVDVFGAGELTTRAPAVNAQYAGYTFGYNRPLVAERVHDILTAIAFAKSHPQTRRVHLVGWESAGPWVVMARALAGDAVSRCAADMNGFRFDSVRTNDDPMMLPGALKYGGMGAFAAMCAPGDLLLHNHRGTGIGRLVPLAYRAANAEAHVRREAEKLSPEAVVDWLLAKP